MKHELRKMWLGGDEEKTRKLNDQPAGFVETKLAGGINSDGGRQGDGDNEQEGCHNQTINTVSPKGKQENEDVTRMLRPCPYISVIIWLQ